MAKRTASDDLFDPARLRARWGQRKPLAPARAVDTTTQPPAPAGANEPCTPSLEPLRAALRREFGADAAKLSPLLDRLAALMPARTDADAQAALRPLLDAIETTCEALWQG